MVRICALAHAPTFKRNLLSVPQVTRNNNCTFVFDRNGGAIVRGPVSFASTQVLARIQRTDEMYTLQARRGGALPHASNVQLQRHHRATTIDEYFKRRKALVQR